MDGIFSQSEDLKKIIERHNWTLYDVSNPPEGRAHTWEEIGMMAPAEHYEIGHNYIFVPIPKDGETLRHVYSLTKGLGPSLSIDNPYDDRWLALEIRGKSNGCVALFTRLCMHESCAFVTTPKIMFFPDPDFVAISYDRLVDTFEKYFRIVPPEEYGLEVPIPSPIVPEMN